MTPPAREPRDCRCPRRQHRHGTAQAYCHDGCRCLPCTAANTAAQGARRRRLAHAHWHGTSTWSSPVGTIRRLQALAAAGWPPPTVAAHLGVTTPEAVHQLRSTRQQRILTSTADRVTAVYDQLWHQTPPAGRSSAYVTSRAAARGWAAPWQWTDRDLDDPAATPATLDDDIDDVAVAEAVHGRRVSLTSAERDQAITVMTGMGLSARAIADRLGVTPRTVVRRRAA